jgi:uncharacterized RDD family membrane protein YckC
MTPAVPGDPGRHEPGSRAEGVYFARSDVAGLGRRLVADCIDATFLLVFWAVLINVWLAVGYQRGIAAGWAWVGWLLACLLFLGPLKRSWLRTPGYRVAGVRVVDLRGGPPTLLAMAARSALYLAGFYFILFDFVWFLLSRRRRKMTDMFAGTYVVRSGAHPQGRGLLVPAYYAVFGYFLVIGEVVPRQSADVPARDQGDARP